MESPYGYNGQMGDGTTAYTTPLSTPTGLTSVSAISAGDGSICALMADGTAKCWGHNWYGQVGNNGVTSGGANVLTPTAVLTSALASLTGISAIAAGHYHTCALTTGGDVKCWGNNSNGQLGDGTTTSRSTASTNVGGITTAQTITFGTAPSVAVNGTGTVSATATSALTVSFTSTTSAKCSVAGSTVTGLSTGTCTIAANQAGDFTYGVAPQVTQDFTIGPDVTPPTEPTITGPSDAAYKAG